MKLKIFQNSLFSNYLAYDYNAAKIIFLQLLVLTSAQRLIKRYALP